MCILSQSTFIIDINDIKINDFLNLNRYMFLARLETIVNCKLDT